MWSNTKVPTVMGYHAGTFLSNFPGVQKLVRGDACCTGDQRSAVLSILEESNLVYAKNEFPAEYVEAASMLNASRMKCEDCFNIACPHRDKRFPVTVIMLDEK